MQVEPAEHNSNKTKIEKMRRPDKYIHLLLIFPHIRGCPQGIYASSTSQNTTVSVEKKITDTEFRSTYYGQ